MEMTILQAKRRLHEKWMELTKDGTDEEMMQALSIADTVLGNYDESLKADVVAMLTEIQTEIDELYSYVEFDEDLKTSFNMVRLEGVQRVIEKYKAGSKDEEE